MAKPKEKEPQAIKLNVRPAVVTNVNIAPEKHGHELVERYDVSISFLLKETELALINCGPKASARDVLWNSKGEPMLTDLDGAFSIESVFEGVAKLGYAKGETVEFDTAKLKKISVEPIMDAQATVNAQVRVDPKERGTMLGRFKVEQACKFGFVGERVVKRQPEDSNEDSQERLEL